jgi:hypothetical protein
LGTFAATLTTSVSVRAPVGIVAPAQLHVTVLVPEQLPPALGVDETHDVPAGRTSETLRFWASDGPLFVAVIV